VRNFFGVQPGAHEHEILLDTRIPLLILACLVSLTGPGQAGPVDLDDRVAGAPGITYFDLMKQVVTDLDSGQAEGKSEPKAHQIVSYRHIEGKDAKTDPAGPVAVSSLAALPVRADGKTRLALLADLGESDGNVAELVLLALFKITATPKLLDVVEVGNDRMTGFADKPLTHLSSDADLIRIDSDHSNADEDFVDTEFIFVRDGRFRLIDAISTFDIKTCTFALSQLPAVTTRPDRGRPYRRIIVTVREQVKLQDDVEGCSETKLPHAFVRLFRATYRWDARRQDFITPSRDMEELAKKNDKLNAADPMIPTKY
jgi:hypothetical protein